MLTDQLISWMQNVNDCHMTFILAVI